MTLFHHGAYTSSQEGRRPGCSAACACRYLLFLHLHAKHGALTLCPTYDIDLLWHAHMASPKLYKAETEVLAGTGRQLAHDDSINDRAPGARLAQLEASTRQCFAEEGEEFARQGAMFRGEPPVVTPEQRRGMAIGALRVGL